MIKRVKQIVKDRILTTLGTLAIIVGIGLFMYGKITGKFELSLGELGLFIFGGGLLIIAPEKLIDKFKI